MIKHICKHYLKIIKIEIKMENNYEFPISHNKFLEITSCTSEKSRGPVNTAKRLCGVSYINYFEEEIFM